MLITSTRRHFLQLIGAAGIVGPVAARAWGQSPAASEPKRLAVITTLWNYHSHAWHMAERFLVGYPRQGRWHQPPLKVVSAYVDQRPEGDLSQRRADEFGFEVYPSVAEALCCGGGELAVDAVLLIGEHGDYPINAIGQKQYPRFELFSQIADVFRRDGRTTPVFNDKHLSWNFAWAKEMVDTSKQLGFPLLAGSSLPVTWRMPAIDMPLGAEIDEALCVAYGPTDIYDFHALETLQCMVERRQGGETGVVAVQALRGPAVWRAMQAGSWAAGGWAPELFEACLSRCHTLAQPESFSHRYPTTAQIEQWVQDPIAYRIEYRDGLKATMLLMNGLVSDFLFAARLRHQQQPLSTLFHLPAVPNVVYSSGLMAKAEEMFITGIAPYPVERTLLTSGLVAACLESLSKEQQRLETPQLAISYQPPQTSQFLRD